MAEKKIGTETWRCDKLGAEESVRLLIRTSKLFGPASAVLGALTMADKDKAKEDVLTTQALAEFVGRLNEEEAISYIRDLVGLCIVKDARGNGSQAQFGFHCQDMDLGEIFGICFWILEVQFRSFLGGALVAGKGLKPGLAPVA